MSSSNTPLIVGQGDFQFEAQPHWAQWPDGKAPREVVGADVDSQKRVYIFTRDESPLMVFAADGSFLKTWGSGKFVRPHGLFVAPDDTVFCTDDYGHAVYRFTPDGEKLMCLGTPGQGSLTGVDNFDYRTMKQTAGPFNAPTNVAMSPEGDIYVSDGYCNARIHKFNPAGEWTLSWGEMGNGPSGFAVPHDVAVNSQGTVFVADRENTRVQLFEPDGTFIAAWTDVARPCQVVFDADDNVYVSELGFQIGMYVGNAYPHCEQVPARVSIFDPQGKLLSRWGAGNYGTHGEFFAAHGIVIDSAGDLYVGEVRPGMYGAKTPPPPEKCAPADQPVLQKFVRQ